jgi:hypothetical protein
VAFTLPATQPAQDISKTCCHDVLLIGQIMTGWCEENCTKSQRRRYIKVSSLVVHKYGITGAYCQLTNEMGKNSLLWFPDTNVATYDEAANILVQSEASP